MYIRTTLVLCILSNAIIEVKERRNKFSGIDCINLQVLKYKNRWVIGQLCEGLSGEYYIKKVSSTSYKSRYVAEIKLKIYGAKNKSAI